MSPSLPGLKNAFLSLLALLLLAVASPSRVLAQAVETEPNDVAAEANALTAGAERRGTIGADGDRFDWYRAVLPAGGSFELTLEGTAMSGSGFDDLIATVYWSNANNTFGSLGTYNVPRGETRRDSFRIFGRAPGDTVYVRLQGVGSFDYGLSFTNRAPTLPPEPEPNNTPAEAIALVEDVAASGQVGYTGGAGVTDRFDWYRAVLPAGGSFEFFLEGTSTSGTGFDDLIATVYRANANNTFGSLGAYNVPRGETQRDTFRIFGRAPGDTIYVRLQGVGSFDYRVRYQSEPPTIIPEREPNDEPASAIELVPDQGAEGQIGYTRDGATDRFDWYRAVLPAGGSFELAIEGTSTSGTGFDDLIATVYWANANNTFGSLGTYNVPRGETQRDSFRIFGRAPGDTIYVRLQGVGSFDYRLVYSSRAPSLPAEPEPNNAPTEALALAEGSMALGQVGYTGGAGVTDRFDWYRMVLPAGGSFELALEGTSTSGSGFDDLIATVYWSNANNTFGSLGTYNVPQYETRRDSFTVYCRAPGDTVYVRLQGVGSFDYRLSYTVRVPAFADDGGGNDVAGDATAFTLPTTLEGRVGHALGGATDQQDWYVYESDGATSLSIDATIDNGTASTFTDLIVTVYDSAGTRTQGTIGFYNVDTGLTRDRSELRCLPAGRHLLRVTQSGCVAYSLRLTERDEQPVAAIETNRFGNRAAFSTVGRVDDVLLWDFDNGQTSAGRFPAQEFAIGVYEVTLRATNQRCRLESRDTVQIVVDGIERYEPQRAELPGAAVGRFSIHLYGAGFDAGTEVRLTRGGRTIEPERIGVPSPAEASALFNMFGVEPGAYDLTVELSSGERFSFPDGFEIALGEATGPTSAEPPVYVSIGGPGRMRNNRWTDFTINVTNPSDRVVNGAVVCVVTPRDFENNFAEILREREGTFMVEGDDWDALTIDRDDFSRLYFEGTFNPAAERIEVDLDEIYREKDSLMNVPIDTFYGEPLEGVVHALYVPVVLAQSTQQIHFQLRSPSSQDVEIIGYAWPFAYRQNPISYDGYDLTKDIGLTAAAVAEQSPVPALRAVGKSAGYVDIGSQVLFAEAFDWWYGTDVADEEFYQEQGTALVGELAGELGAGGRIADQRKIRRASNQMESLTKSSTSLRSAAKRRTISGRKIYDKQTREQLERVAKRYKDEVTKLGKDATDRQKQAAVDKIKDIIKDKIKEGLDPQQLEEFLDELDEPDDPDNPDNPDDPNDPDDPNNPRPRPIDRKRLQTRASFDPNAIYGESGYGDERYVRRASALNYTVTFENVDTAEIPAQIVRVELDLDPATFDLGRSGLGDVMIGGKTFFMPDDRTEYFRDLDLRPAQPYVVRLSAKLDTTSGRLLYTFATLDPVTLDVPADPFAGFLPPNKNPPEGDGGFSFTTYLRPGLETGDVASAQALIYFDDNELIATEVWTNAVDETRPRADATEAFLEGDSTLVVRYGGSDLGAGVSDYALRIRRDASPWLPIDIPLPDDGEIRVPIDPNRRYEMYVVATDSVGLRERQTPMAEVTYAAGQVIVGTSDPTARTPRITLYPNPASNSQNSVLRSHVDVGRATLEVFDALGRRVRSTPVELSAGGEVAVPTQGLPAGMYLVRVTDARGEEMAARLVVR